MVLEFTPDRCVCVYTYIYIYVSLYVYIQKIFVHIKSILILIHSIPRSAHQTCSFCFAQVFRFREVTPGPSLLSGSGASHLQFPRPIPWQLAGESWTKCLGFGLGRGFWDRKTEKQAGIWRNCLNRCWLSERNIMNITYDQVRSNMMGRQRTSEKKDRAT